MDRTVSSLPSRKRHRGLSSASVAASRGGAGRRRSHGRPDHFRGSQQAHAGKSVASRASSTRSARFSSTSTHPAQVPRQQSHVVCAISENLARETCIVSLDTACPMILNVTKQCNSQTYSETIACLSIVGPDEILMNEGRQHSPLAHKVMQHCKYQREAAKETLDAVGDTDSSSGSTTTIKFISRAFFDQTRGADLLRRLARKDTYDCNSLVQEYILLSSSHAVLQYTQKCLGLSFMNNCLDIRSFLYDTNGTICPRVMDIDRATIVQLELLASTRPGKGKQASLIAAMDCTKTSVGNRLLRSTIMSPPCRMATIQARLELVTTFLSNEQLFFSVLEQLKSLNPIDKMLSDVAMVPTTTAFNANGMGNASTNAASTVSGVYANTMTVVKQNVANARLARKGIASLIGIKTTLGMIPLIASTLKNHLKASIGTVHEKEGDAEASVATDRTSLLVGLGVGDFASLAATTLTKKTASTLGSNNVSRKHYLLRGIVFALSQPELENIRKEIDNSLRGNTMHSKSGNVQRHQECFALRRSSGSDGDGMIDVVRKAFLKNVDDIYKLADHYAEVHGFHVTVRYQNNRGYFLSVPVSVELPSDFVQPSKTGSGAYIHCTTEEVQSLNARAQDNINDILRLTHERIEELLDFARSKYDALARVSDAIALLDLCHSFADRVTLDKEDWVLPKLFDRSESMSDAECVAISIRDGRCPMDIAAMNHGMSHMVVNDTLCTPSGTFTVVSGVNGSGKSTYLKQVATTVLLAHCGSYVPASEASIPLTTRLCARMGSTDDLENNISSFMKEMKETAYICKNATTSSLMLLDELGRETSNEDGVAIAWSVAEHLIARGAPTFFATHYPQICQMSQVYPSVRNLHLETSMPSDCHGKILYTHKVQNGPCVVSSDYGVHIAASTGFPEDVVEHAKSIEGTVKGAIAKRSNLNRDYDTERRHKKLLKAKAKELHDLVNNASNIKALRIGLQSMKEDFAKEIPSEEVKKFCRLQ